MVTGTGMNAARAWLSGRAVSGKRRREGILRLGVEKWQGCFFFRESDGGEKRAWEVDGKEIYDGI